LIKKVSARKQKKYMSGSTKNTFAQIRCLIY